MWPRNSVIECRTRRDIRVTIAVLTIVLTMMRKAIQSPKDESGGGGTAVSALAVASFK